MQPGAADEPAALERFKIFYLDFSAATIREGVRGLYDAQAIFCDPFRSVTGIDQIETYFLSSVKSVHSCRFDIQDVAGENGEYYFRWVMHLILNRNLSRDIQILGMSHVRFDPEGKIVFHQDYWDASQLFAHFPVLGAVIRRIKNRI